MVYLLIIIGATMFLVPFTMARECYFCGIRFFTRHHPSGVIKHRSSRLGTRAICQRCHMIGKSLK